MKKGLLSEQSIQKLTEMLIKHEGEKLQVYDCPAGYATIGVGRNLQTKGLSKAESDRLQIGTYDKNAAIAKLEVRGITKDESRYLLANDIDYFATELDESLSYFCLLPETAKITLIDMAFNMGVGGLLKFVHTLENIEHGRYIAASKEMLNSAWKNQVGQRAYDLAEMLATCQ